ncbi:hypothetical protein Pstr01_23690 [Pseudomonas straminea]|uniref:PQQ-like domain-containing protein n=1 Tax=Pseudomonas straminea TaxID=47882 RepID=A0A1I1UGA9_PSEOC|nr:hypothetical protein [Pseudomonas straminea]GLX14130.1 hypothetical protein Pstr01_23690 [Pseudomonas straminea]SFD69744.1 hypothetical protein SAMN05216372_103326 [Pseudomonas straminea]
MAVGIPAKKATFRFAQKFNGVVSTAIGGDQLYVLYSSKGTEGERYFKAFDLPRYNGLEDNVPARLRRKAEPHWRPMFLESGLLYVFGESPELIDVADWQPRYSEHESVANPEWATDGRFAYDGKRIYRAFGWNDYSRGLDIVENGKVVDHVDIDIQYFMPAADGLIYGVRLSAPVFCVYSLTEKTVKLEIPLGCFEFAPGVTLAPTSRDGDTLYVLAGDHVLVIDLTSFTLVGEFAYFNTAFMQTLVAGMKYKNQAFPRYISAHGGTALLSNVNSSGFVLCLSTVDGTQLWARKSNDEILAANTDGDLVFGLEERRPRAWDKYTGEEVWQASAGTIANTIEVSGDWVVYHQPAGDIQCFTWKKPYSSPHRRG